MINLVIAFIFGLWNMLGKNLLSVNSIFWEMNRLFISKRASKPSGHVGVSADTFVPFGWSVTLDWAPDAVASVPYDFFFSTIPVVGFWCYVKYNDTWTVLLISLKDGKNVMDKQFLWIIAPFNNSPLLWWCLLYKFIFLATQVVVRNSDIL